MKGSKMLKKADIIFLISIICVAVLALLWILYGRQRHSETEEKYVVIYIDKEPCETCPLDQDAEVLLPTEDGDSELVISGGSCYMKSAHCPDQICVRHKAISKSGESIVCLPHKVVVEISSEEEQDVDIVA